MDSNIKSFNICPIHIHHCPVRIYFIIWIISMIFYHNMSTFIKFGLRHNIVKPRSIRLQISLVNFGCTQITPARNLIYETLGYIKTSPPIFCPNYSSTKFSPSICYLNSQYEFRGNTPPGVARWNWRCVHIKIIITYTQEEYNGTPNQHQYMPTGIPYGSE